MPTIKIPAGVVRAETRQVVPGRWHQANLVRWANGQMQSVGGHDRITKNPLRSIPRHALVYRDTLNKRGMVVACDGALFRAGSPDFVDITPAGLIDANTDPVARGYGSGNFGIKNFGSDAEERGDGTGGFDPAKIVCFSLDMWNNELLFVSSVDGRTFVWNVDTPNVQPSIAANVPLLVQAILVTEEHHVMTFGSQGFPNRVAWSDQDDRLGWDYSRVEGQAGFYDLEGAGSILAAYKIPGAVLVFTDTSVWECRYIGQPYYYGFRKIAEGSSPISAHAVAVAGSRVFWMGQKGFWKYEGGIVTSLAHTLGTDFFDTMDEVAPRRVCAGYNGLYPEIWWFFPKRQDELIAPALRENDRYVIMSFQQGSEWWADGDMSRSFYLSSPIDNYPIAGSDQSQIYQHEKGFDGEGRGEVFAEVTSISFDDGASNFTVHQCQLDNSGGFDAISFDFHGRYVRGGPRFELQSGLLGREDGFLDTRFTARDFDMRVTGIKPVSWGLGAMIFHKVKQRGSR